MGDASTHLDRLVTQMAADTGIDIVRGPDRQYLFGSADAPEKLIALEPGTDPAYFVCQTLLGKIDADAPASLLRQLLALNTVLVARGYPTLSLNPDSNAVLCNMNLRRTDENGIEREAVWLQASLAAFNTSSTLMAQMLDLSTGTFASETVDAADAPGEPSPEVIFRP